VGLCVCVGHVGELSKTDEPIEVPSRVLTCVRKRNRALYLPRGNFFGAPPECLASGQYSQPYSVCGSSNEAFRCQYCNKLLLLQL